MKILQWSMTIPLKNQDAFLKFSKEKLSVVWKNFGCIEYNCYKVGDKKLVVRQTVEDNRFVEQLKFEDEFDISSFFLKVRSDPVANRLSKTYEEKFGFYDIELRVLESQ